MKIKLTRVIDVLDLTEEDIKSLDKNTLQRIAIELTKSSLGKDTHPKTTLTATANPKTSVKTSNTRSNSKLSSYTSKASGKSKGHEIGTKSGKSSEHHYVYWHTASKSYRTTHSNSSYSSELEASIASDAYLDAKGDTRKPRNRDKFQEVAEAYAESHSTPAISSYVSENGIQ